MVAGSGGWIERINNDRAVTVLPALGMHSQAPHNHTGRRRRVALIRVGAEIWVRPVETPPTVPPPEDFCLSSWHCTPDGWCGSFLIGYWACVAARIHVRGAERILGRVRRERTREREQATGDPPDGRCAELPTAAPRPPRWRPEMAFHLPEQWPRWRSRKIMLQGNAPNRPCVPWYRATVRALCAR